MQLLPLLLLFNHHFQVFHSEGLHLDIKPIRFCAGIHEWPPYYYFKRPNLNNSNEIGGLDIQLFDAVFNDNGIKYTTELLSWKKCLAEVLKGDKYDVVFGGGLNPFRAANYVTTKGYYVVTPTFFYSLKEFPNGVHIGVNEDFEKVGHLCGVGGFNYVNFGLENHTVEMGAPDYVKLVEKTLFARCKVSFARYEILEGWGKLLSTDLVNHKELHFEAVPGVPKESFHLMISKKYALAHELKAFFESQIGQLQHQKHFHWLTVESSESMTKK